MADITIGIGIIGFISNGLAVLTGASDIATGTGLIGIISSGFVTLTGGVLLLRKFLSKDAVDRAGYNANLQIIVMLREQVHQERERADAATKARDQALSEIRQLRDQVSELTVQVELLQTQITVLTKSSQK